MTQNIWRQQFLKLEEAKRLDLEPHHEFNTKLEFLKTAVGFNPDMDNYYLFHATDWHETGDFDFDSSYRRYARYEADENELPYERFFVRCGAITKNYGYPEDASYNWRVFDKYGSATYLTAQICELMGFEYYDGYAENGIPFETNLQSKTYRAYKKIHEDACAAIDKQKKHLTSQEIYQRNLKWKHEWNSLYNAYLKSSEWMSRSKRRIEIDGYQCTNCGEHGKGAILQAHHITYKNVGDENIADDLVTLCIHCHQDHHGKKFA